MSTITPIVLPIPIDWDYKKAIADQHVEQVTEMFAPTSSLLYFYMGALAEVTIEEVIPRRKEVASYWVAVLQSNKPVESLKAFFSQWLTYTPTPANPGKYIEIWDYLVNTQTGRMMANADVFKPWFRQFLNFHGDWINSTSSTSTLADWMKYQGTTEHPFDINDYEVPCGGFASFNQFFLRNLKPDQRPLCDTADQCGVVVAPCDGGVFYLNRDDNEDMGYLLPGKSGDRFDLIDAIPGYGENFVGGALLDILLWFTDYHHFHAPVSGEVIMQGLYRGSYNYDFDNFDPNDPFAPLAPADSDKVGWYKKLGKHQRYVWVFQTEDLGLVAMIAVGFWGVGSIVPAQEKSSFEKGDYMGHFGYGGSSIVLAFEPAMELQFQVGDQPVEGPDQPTLMKVRECLGKRID